MFCSQFHLFSKQPLNPLVDKDGTSSLTFSDGLTCIFTKYPVEGRSDIIAKLTTGLPCAGEPRFAREDCCVSGWCVRRSAEDGGAVRDPAVDQMF